MSQRFDFNSTPLQGLYRIEHKPFKDQRGFFSRLFCAEEFKEIGLVKPIMQINRTLTKSKGTVRGMHFQYPSHTETKMVTCIRGLKLLCKAIDVLK